jgi:hypothetical protein
LAPFGRQQPTGIGDIKIKKIVAYQCIIFVRIILYFNIKLLKPGNRLGCGKILPFPGSFFNLVNEDSCALAPAASNANTSIAEA